MKKTTLTNKETGEKLVFDSKSAACKFLGGSNSLIDSKIQEGINEVGDYFFEVEDIQLKSYPFYLDAYSKQLLKKALKEKNINAEMAIAARLKNFDETKIEDYKKIEKSPITSIFLSEKTKKRLLELKQKYSISYGKLLYILFSNSN